MKFNTLALGFIFAFLVGTTNSAEKKTPDSTHDSNKFCLYGDLDEVDYKRELTAERIGFFKLQDDALFRNSKDLQTFLSDNPQYIKPYPKADFVIDEETLAEVLVVTDKQMSLIRFFKQDKSTKLKLLAEQIERGVMGLNTGIYPIVLRMHFHDVPQADVSKILALSDNQIRIVYGIIYEVHMSWALESRTSK